MKILVHCLPTIGWHRRYYEFFREGFRKHGIHINHTASPVAIDGTVPLLFGPNYWKGVERASNKYLMVNRKFVGNVNDNVAISWNGYNGQGRFCVQDVSPTRLRRHTFDIEPWREVVDGYTLLLGQFDLGRCGRYTGLREWYNHVEANTGDKILFRKWPGSDRPLKKDLAGARLAVSLNSTVAIETVLQGVPTVAMDEQSPAWPICAHNLGHVHRSNNRLAWLEYLANCQWHYLQIQNGDFWRQLFPVLGPRLCDVEF